MRMLDLLAHLFRFFLDEILMNRETHRRDSIAKCLTLELAQVGAMFGSERLLFGDVHLAVEDVKGFDPDLGAFIDHLFDRHLWIAKMPIGIRGDTQLDSFLGLRRATGGECWPRAEGKRGK